MTRIVTTMAMLLGLTACTELQLNGSSKPQAKDDNELQPQVLLPSPADYSGQDMVNSLLLYRQHQCPRPKSEREQLLQLYRGDSSTEAVLHTLMLATCVPHETPGLLANALVSARNIEPLTPELDAFLMLLSAEAESYALLERHLENTQKRLDDMIRGIRAIETEMEASSNGGGEP